MAPTGIFDDREPGTNWSQGGPGIVGEPGKIGGDWTIFASVERSHPTTIVKSTGNARWQTEEYLVVVGFIPYRVETV